MTMRLYQTHDSELIISLLMPSVDFRLYLVTDRQQTSRATASVGRGSRLSAGVRAVQMRERDLVRDS